MTAVPPLEAAHRRAKARKKRRTFNIYPLLGVLLLLLAAVLTYGGLFLLLPDDWNVFQAAGPRQEFQS